MTHTIGPTFARVTVEDSSQVPSARSLAVGIAREAGRSTVEIDRLALAATELAQNLHRHAVGGEFVVGLGVPGRGSTGRRIALIALDRGPGVADMRRCLVDGYSTAGTMGTGLGAVRRLAHDFDAVSEPGLGTVVSAGFTDGAEQPLFDTGVLGFPIATESVNGDSCAFVRRGSRVLVMLADGLGHGPLAADASSAAARELESLADHRPATVLAGLNDRIAATRGAAVTVASLELGDARAGGSVVTSGLGNVSIVVAGPDGSTKRVATSHGTAGARRNVHTSEQSTPFPARGCLILHTDGLGTRWGLEGRAELLRHSCEVVAAVLWRDFARGTDDSMVAVVRADRGPESG